MSMVVAHNIAAINANKNLYGANRSLNSSLSKLSSGYRINTGQDGPADLVISEKLRAQNNGLERAVRNTTESINVLSIAEGALNEMNAILKKMKALAIHAANNGITSPDQVASDQAEMDSGIQTLERIANNTRYSDQFLLNGSKGITYNVNTSVDGTQNNRLTNTSLSNFNQIFKRDGYQVTIGYQGALAPDKATQIGNTAMSRQASKAYLEIDAYAGSISQVNKNGNLTQGQSFILTGSLGARQFRFSEGAKVSAIVNAIHNVAGSTGVDASLTFNRKQMINNATEVGEAEFLGITKTDTGCGVITMYDNYTVKDDGSKALIATKVELGQKRGIIYGKNTDGQGNVFVKIVDATSGAYELYKDSSLSKESLIGTGVSGTTDSVERNNSGLTLQVTVNKGVVKYGDVFRVSLGNVSLSEFNEKAASSTGSAVAKGTGACAFKMSDSTASGVQLGINTSTEGKIFLKTVYDQSGTKAMIYAYNNELMREQDMVAKTIDFVDMKKEKFGVILDSIWNEEHTANTGLGLTLALAARPGTAQDSDYANNTYTGEIEFTNLGARIFSSEYGSNATIQIQQLEGGLFVDYEDVSNYDSAKLIEAGITFTKTGQDATITVNGQQMKTNGLHLNLATPDIMADITFNAGKSGTTTLAQVGYGEGSVFTKNTSLTLAYGLNSGGSAKADKGSNNTSNARFTGLLNNAGHNTSENIGNFQGGMQLQLGEGSGDQERTVIGVKSMSTAQLGRMEVTKQFDPNKAVIETKTLSIQDVMGGQLAGLAQDPSLAMKIIEKAISDVSNLRAQIGAVQANMLQTNENNLRVAIENITKTESNIRDTDMASEMTEFTKNQILSNAGTSMLSQANQQAQNVLQLLR